MVPSILIVEDDLTFSTMLKTWLWKKGFEVETASTQAKARKQIGTRDFDLILSDLRLPDQDGLSLLSWLREQGNQVPFIIMTSYAEIQSAVRAMKEGATDYISKPVQPDELLKKIKEAIHQEKTPAESGKEKNAAQTAHGILYEMRKKCPEKNFIPAPPEDSTCACNECNFMRLNTLEKLYNTLKYEWPEVNVDEAIAQEAIKPIQKMLEISAKLGL